MPDRDAPALPPWAAPFAASFERVAHQLELAEGFMLLPVELPDLPTAALLARELTRRGHPCRLIDANDAATQRTLLAALLTDPRTDPRTDPGPAALSLLFVNTLGDGLEAGLQLLNQQRDLLARSHPRPLLWCGPSRFLDLSWRLAPDLWSVAAVPIRLATPPIRGLAPAPTPSLETALIALITKLFDDQELRWFIDHYYEPEIAASLPDPSAPLSQVAATLVKHLARRGLINMDLFRRLRHMRPPRYPEIDEVARQWHNRPDLESRSRQDLAVAAVRERLRAPSNLLLFVSCTNIDHLDRVMHAALRSLPFPNRLRILRVPAEHDAEDAWRGVPKPDRDLLAPHENNTQHITLVLDGASRPLGDLDHEQQQKLRHLVNQAMQARAHGVPSLIVVPLAGAPSTVTMVVQHFMRGVRPGGSFPTASILDLDQL